MKRFWDKVSEDSVTDCWPWTGYKDKDGYGIFNLYGQNVRAHRFILRLIGVNVPKTLHVLHTCDNPACVNPIHLFLGTDLINQYDCLYKKRNADTRGSKNGNATITEELVIAILQQRKLGLSRQDLMKAFNLPETTINGIIYKKSWKHVHC